MNLTRGIDESRRPAGRILIVSYWFQPALSVASIRTGKLAKHLRDRGWDVRVLAAAATGAPETLPLDIPREIVTYAPWIQVDQYLQNALQRLSLKRPAAPPASTPDASATHDPEEARQRSRLRNAARAIYQEIVRWPDNRAGWLKPAAEAGDNLVASWRPDVIFATSPPPTSLVLADRLARKHGIPWVAEFRDLWSDHPYYEYSAVRRWFERAWDQRVVSRASAIVTVSPIWQPRLEARYGRPTTIAMNGFVADDFPEQPPVAPETSGPLRIVYTGHIYRGHRDPTALFRALRKVGAAPTDVVVEFIGTENKGLFALSAAEGVADLVRVYEPVSYRRALELQLHADVLLHLQWCDPKEVGTIAGKIFDYLYTRRPILGIALEDSVVAKMIHERNAGLVTNDVAKIAERLDGWLREKHAGGIAPLPESASRGLERALQFEKIRSLLAGILKRTPQAADAPAAFARSD